MEQAPPYQSSEAVSPVEQSRFERRRKLERARLWARQRAESARTGFFTSIMLARWAIHLAARAEPNTRVRKARENILLNRWNRFAGDLSRLPYLRR